MEFDLNKIIKNWKFINLYYSKIIYLKKVKNIRKSEVI